MHTVKLKCIHVCLQVAELLLYMYTCITITIAAKKSLEDIRRLYFRLKEQVFKGNGIIARYLGFCDSQKLEELLIDTFGRETKMSDITYPR